MSDQTGSTQVFHHTMEIPRCILSRTDLSGCEKVTLMALYLYASRGQIDVWPSNPTLSADTGHRRVTIEKHLTKLTKLGLITRSSSGGKRTITLPTEGGVNNAPSVRMDPTLPTEGTHPPHVGSLHYRNQPLNQPVSGPTKEAEASAPPLYGDNPAQVRSAPAPRPTPEVETRDGAQQSIAGCDPGDGAERPRKESKNQKWITDRWAQFTRIHRMCQDALIAEGSVARRSSFECTLNVRRMLGRLHKERYTPLKLHNAWVAFAVESEKDRSMRYFKPATCFVAANIDRKLQFIAEREAREE